MRLIHNGNDYERRRHTYKQDAFLLGTQKRLRLLRRHQERLKRLKTSSYLLSRLMFFWNAKQNAIKFKPPPVLATPRAALPNDEVTSMAKRQHISAEQARQLLSYDRQTGILRWKQRTPDMFKSCSTPDRYGRLKTAEHNCNNWNAHYAGKIAGTNIKGYVSIIITLRGKKCGYLAHRLAFLIETGEWPPHDIDHDDRARSNNKWSNIRPATRAQNRQNVSLSKNNTSGFTGVSWSKEKKKYIAHITKDREYFRLGYFNTAEEASEAYKAAKKRLHTFNPELQK